MGRKQFENFVKGEYVAQHKQRLFHGYARAADKPEALGDLRYIGLGGARGPGKSHAIMAQVFLDDCQRQPNLKVLFLRKIQRTAAESFEDLISRILQKTPHHYISSKGRVDFPNGSRVLIGGYRSSSEIMKYIGIEYDIIVIEECTLLDYEQFQKVDGSLRTSLPGWRPRMYVSTNPGNIGHQWFYKMFVEPSRKGDERETRFIECNWKDNAFLDVDYKEYLRKLQGDLGRQWRDGDWDAFGGKGFPGFSLLSIFEGGNVCKPFQIPDNYPIWRGVDSGYANPFCTLFGALEPHTSRLYIISELYQAGLSDEQQAKMIVVNTPPYWDIRTTFADPAMFAENKPGLTAEDGRTKSSAKIYGLNGVPVVRGDNNRKMGKRKVERFIEPLPDGIAGLVIFDTCTHLIEQLNTLTTKNNDPEDVDTRQEDHAFDTLKYLMTRVDFPERTEYELKFLQHKKRMYSMMGLKEDEIPRPLEHRNKKIMESEFF